MDTPPFLGNVNDTVDRLMAADVAPRPEMPRPQAPSFLGAMAPIAAALVAGRGNPAAVGRGLAAFLQGQRLKRSEREHEQDRQAREQRENATFAARAFEQAQQITDPLAFEQWKTAIAPLAKIHGLDPNTIPFNDKGRQDRDRVTVQAAVDRAVRLHGPEILNRDDVSVQLGDGRQVNMREARSLLGGTVTAEGAPVTVPDTTKVPTPRQAPQPGSFEDYHSETDPARRQQILEDRKVYQQIDDRAPRVTVNAGGVNSKAVAQAVSQGRAFDSLPIVKTIQKQAEAVSFADRLDPDTKNPADDQALIYAFAKAMDPDSVVREGEYATVQKYAQSWAQSFGFNAARIFSNTPFLSRQARQNMKATIRARYEAGLEQYRNVRKGKVDLINKLTGEADGDAYLTDYEAGFPAPVATPAPTAAPTRGLGSYQDYQRSRRAR